MLNNLKYAWAMKYTEPRPEPAPITENPNVSPPPTPDELFESRSEEPVSSNGNHIVESPSTGTSHNHLLTISSPSPMSSPYQDPCTTKTIIKTHSPDRHDSQIAGPSHGTVSLAHDSLTENLPSSLNAEEPDSTTVERVCYCGCLQNSHKTTKRLTGEYGLIPQHSTRIATIRARPLKTLNRC